MFYLGLITALGISTRAFAQPAEPPATTDLPCSPEPTNQTTVDTLASTLDAEGFYSLFNGTDFKGLAQTCADANHTSNKNKGAIIRVDPTLKALFTASRDGQDKPATTGGDGGLVVVRQKKVTNYEIQFDAWPGFLNDGGLFNRTTWDGSCYQTVLDYTDGAASWLGSYCEKCVPGTASDLRPFGFNGQGGDPHNIDIPGAAGNANWTNITRASNPTSYGCPTTGCVKADWGRLWDFNGWNQNRVLFYGGNTAGAKIYMKSYFRKTSADPWVPVLLDSSNSGLIQPGYIAFQVHGGGRFRNPKGTWYRNIRWRPLDNTGVPLFTPTHIVSKSSPKSPFTISGGTLNGFLAEKHEVTVRDARGTLLERFSGQPGNFSYPIKSSTKGWVALEVKTSKGVEHFNIVHQ